MKILVVTQYFWPENFRINELVAEWGKCGHEVVVLTGLPNYPDGKIFAQYKAKPDEFARYEGARIVRVPMFARGTSRPRLLLNYASFALSASLIGAWKLRGEKVDVIFSFEPSPITVGIPAAVMRRLKKAPHAMWVLDLWPETLSAVGILKEGAAMRAIGRLVKWVYTRCDLILAQSKSFVTSIRRYTDAGKPINYFPAWADLPSPEGQEPSAAPEVAPAGEGVFTVMFAGNIGEAQDFPAILKAMEALKNRADIRWVIVGDGRMAGWVRQAISERQLEERVVMAGRYPLERMPSFFLHADALLVSLKDEPIFAMTIPGKLQTYLATGIPVLAMLNGEGAGIVQEAGAGLTCSAGDGAALAANIESLAALKLEERQKMGADGKAYCEQFFSRDQLIETLDSWLASLVEEAGKRNI